MLKGKGFDRVRGLAAMFGYLLITAGVLLGTPDHGGTASIPKTVAEIALYQGSDREQVLIAGAKKEGEVMFYNSNSWLDVVGREFEKKYPFVKVSIWRGTSPDLIKRTTEEYAAGRYLVDVIEASGGILVFYEKGIFQEYYSPEIAAYKVDAKAKGKNGVYYLPDREMYLVSGFNTKLVSPAEAPKTYKDLIDPKWKGKMALPGGSIGPQWVGHLLNVMGRDYLENLGRQDVKVQNLAAAAVAALVVSGEIPLSPCLLDSNIIMPKDKGAPVDWFPLEPVVAHVGSSGMTTKAPHPHAALLFLDYLHSKEGQQVVVKGKLNSPREDIVSSAPKFKKTYLEAQYSPEEFERKFVEWEELMRRLFIRKR